MRLKYVDTTGWEGYNDDDRPWTHMGELRQDINQIYRKAELKIRQAYGPMVELIIDAQVDIELRSRELTLSVIMMDFDKKYPGANAGHREIVRRIVKKAFYTFPGELDDHYIMNIMKGKQSMYDVYFEVHGLSYKELLDVIFKS